MTAGAGIGNNVVFSQGFRLQPSDAQDINRMQAEATDVARINHTGNPEGVVAANPSSLCHDPVSGAIYAKIGGTGNTGWSQLLFPLTAINSALVTDGSGVASFSQTLPNAVQQNISLLSGNVIGQTSNPGGTNALQIINLSTAANSHAVISVFTQSGGGNAYFSAQQNGGQSYQWGYNSSNQNFELYSSLTFGSGDLLSRMTPLGVFSLPLDNLSFGINTISTTNTNGNLILAPNGVGYVSPLADNTTSMGGNTKNWSNVFTKGLTFDNASHTMTEYTYGTFTPTLTGASTAGTTTYSSQDGVYVKVGNMVTINVHINISAATGTGDLVIGGIPYSPYANTAATSGIYWSGGAGWTWPAGRTNIAPYWGGGNFRIACSGSGVSVTNMQMANAPLEIFFTLTFASF